MARYVWPTAEEQIDKHLDGVIITDEVREELRRSLTPVAIIRKGGAVYWSCCQRYGEYPTANHREYGECPFCGQRAYHIKQYYISKEERQENFHFLYRKSAVEENTILIIGVWVAQIWKDAKDGEPEDVSLRVEVHSLIVIPYGGRPVKYINESCGWYYRGWQRRDRVTGGSTTSWTGNAIATVNHSWERTAALRGTRFEKMIAWFEETRGIYYTQDCAGVLAEIAKYPQMEYLVARGLGELVRDKMNHMGPSGIVNWKAKSIDKMLPLTRDELGRIKAKGYKITTAHLMPMYYARLWRQHIKLEDAMAVIDKLGTYNAAQARAAVRQYGGRYGVMRILRYFAGRKQTNVDPRMWMDYMVELAQLDCLGDESMVFPRDLQEAHAQTSARIQIKESEADQAKLAEILPELAKQYTFQAGNVVMEPFATLREVIEEGTTLSICIGSYAKRYAAGGTILCKMRHADAPDKPWHAVEFSKAGVMMQCRGYKNKTYREDEGEVRDFWKAWDKAHKTSTRVYLTIANGRMTA